MELTINIEDYITPEDIKSVALETVRSIILRTFGTNEHDVARLITNLSYEYIFKAVSDAIGEDAQTKISNKVRELLEDGGSIKYELWRRKDVWEKTESPAIPILHKAIKDNEGLIRAKVMQSIDGYEFGDVQEAMYDALISIVYEKVFGKESEGEE